MGYRPASDVNTSASETLKHVELLNPGITQSQHDTIRDTARNETPPSAPNIAAERENCQHWILTVLERMQAAGIVAQDKVDKVYGFRQPLAHEGH